MTFCQKFLFVVCFVQLVMQPWQAGILHAQQPTQSSNAQIPETNDSKKVPILPNEWLGSWQGEVKSESAQSQSSTFQMNLAIAASDKPDRLLWTITYDGPQGKSVRDYELVKKDDQPAHFVIDEKNGIEIDATLIEKAMLSHFSVSGQTIWSKYELLNTDPSEMIFELVVAPSSTQVQSGGKDGVPEVTSLLPATRQIARLKRIASAVEPTTDSLSRFTKWEKLETEPQRGKQDDIFFVDDQVGWYANGTGKIFKTIDGGDSWKLQRNTPGTFFRCLAFIDQQHGFAGNIGPDYFPNVTDNNPLYETKDGGETWNVVTTIEGKPVVGLCAMQVLRDEPTNAGESGKQTRLIGVGRVGGPTAMIISDDLGATWQQIDISAHAAMAFDVYFQDRNVGFIAAATDTDIAKSHASILRTDDGGATWQKVYESSRPYELTWKMAFPSRDTCYVTIQSYNPNKSASARFVAKSQDGGRTWSEIPLVDDHAVRQFGVAFLDDQTGWVGALPNGFFTNDGGQTWHKASMGNAVNKIRLLSTPSKTVGFAIGTEVHRIEIPKDVK